jgi:hypothetical protein
MECPTRSGELRRARGWRRFRPPLPVTASVFGRSRAASVELRRWLLDALVLLPIRKMVRGMRLGKTRRREWIRGSGGLQYPCIPTVSRSLFRRDPVEHRSNALADTWRNYGRGNREGRKGDFIGLRAWLKGQAFIGIKAGERSSWLGFLASSNGRRLGKALTRRSHLSVGSTCQWKRERGGTAGWGRLGRCWAGLVPWSAQWLALLLFFLFWNFFWFLFCDLS